MSVGSDHPWRRRGHGMDNLCARDCPDRKVGCRTGCEKWAEHLRLTEERRRKTREAHQDEEYNPVLKQAYRERHQNKR